MACKQNNVQVIDMHIRLTANGVLKDFTDGQTDTETNPSYLDERKREAIDLGTAVLSCQCVFVFVCAFVFVCVCLCM